MVDHEEQNEEEEQPLEARAHGVEELHDLAVVVEHLEDPEQLGQLDELVQPAEPCDLCQVGIVSLYFPVDQSCLGHHEVEGYDGDQVHREPSLGVGLADLAPVLDQLEGGGRLEGRVEVDDNVYEEHAVHKVITHNRRE